MNYLPGIFSNDLVNKDGFRITAKALAKSVEREHISAIQGNLPSGLPSNYAHDWHRPLGWCVTTGFFIEANVVRQVGYIMSPSTDQEIQEITNLRDDFTNHDDRQVSQVHREELFSRTGVNNDDSVKFLRYPARMMKLEGIARRLYSEYFDQGSKYVDKDGLVDYRALLQKFEEVEPGTFLDKERKLLVFAHKYFRRSLSHRNALNESFLGDFSLVAARNADLKVRIRLDEDIVGYPENFLPPLEMDYWRGPKFSDDIAHIPSGVTVHADTEKIEGISQTHFWWKNAEKRVDRPSPVRTFEAEELRVHPSYGISETDFGCRYVHAEFDQGSNTISHFDGAIRCYNQEAFNIRQTTSIDRAGKHSRYTKLFRFDGNLSVADWKSLSSNYFRGNTLVTEYFEGSPQKEDIPEIAAPDNRFGLTDGPETLKGFIGYSAISEVPEGVTLQPILESSIRLEQEKLFYLEYTPSQLGEWLAKNVDLDKYNLGDFSCNIFNMPRIFINGDDRETKVSTVLSELLVAARADNAAGRLNEISLSLCWVWKEILVTVSIAGPIGAICHALQDMPNIIKPNLAPSLWIEAFEKLIEQHCPVKKVLSSPLRYLHGMTLLNVPRPPGIKTFKAKLRRGAIDIPIAIKDLMVQGNTNVPEPPEDAA